MGMDTVRLPPFCAGRVWCGEWIDGMCMWNASCLFQRVPPPTVGWQKHMAPGLRPRPLMRPPPAATGVFQRPDVVVLRHVDKDTLAADHYSYTRIRVGVQTNLGGGTAVFRVRAAGARSTSEGISRGEGCETCSQPPGSRNLCRTRRPGYCRRGSSRW